MHNQHRSPDPTKIERATATSTVALFFIFTNLHRHHIQGDVLQPIAKAIHQSPSPIHFFKVKSHAGIIDNEHADALAKKSATTYSDIADTSIKTAGPEGNPFYNIHWLAKKDIEN